MTRAALRQLPLPELQRRADAILRANAARYGLPSVRARGCSVAWLVEIVIGAEGWATRAG